MDGRAADAEQFGDPEGAVLAAVHEGHQVRFLSAAQTRSTCAGPAPLRALAMASGRADLQVLGSRGRGGFLGLAVGSATPNLLHMVGCPTAVVHART